MGPKRSGSAFHMDPNATHAWNATIVGKKRWIFYPPGVTPPGIFPSRDGDSVMMPISIGEWLLNYYHQHRRQQQQEQQQQQCPILECTVEPGDVVFVPHGWWHAVINISDGIHVAITHNYVSRSNLPTVLRFLDRKQKQISGCRDREESIKPEFLLEAFQRGLEKNGLSHLLREAQQVALEGWPCRAWTNDDDDDSVGNNTKSKKRKRQYHQRREHQHQRRQKQGRETALLGTSSMAKAKQNLPNGAAAPAGSNHSQAFSFSFFAYTKN